jgi:hypothetical protein
MKRNTTLQRWILSGLALASSSGLCLAADISFNFDSDVQGWYAADGHGSVVWDDTHGRGGGGCLKYTIVGDTDGEIDPRVDVEFDTTGYFSVEFDMMVDENSGTDANGSYGNLQIIARNAGWSWDSMWFGAVGTAFNSYQHVKKAFTSAYELKAYLQMQLSGTAPYSSDVVIYIDNVVIRDGTPPNMAMMFDFAWPEEVTTGFTQWAGGSPAADGITVSHDTTVTNGALKFTVGYNASNSGWQEGDVQIAAFDWDPSKFTWLEFDLYLEAPAGLSTYGGFSVVQISSSWSWQGIGGPGLTAANIGTWTHYKLPINNMTGSHGLVLQVGGGMTVPLTYYVDNIELWKPSSPPTISTKLQKSTGAGGVKITMDQNASQYQRDAICSPSNPGNCFWYGYSPVTYSFTITNFPDALAHYGFEAHLYIVNEDTIPDAGTRTWNETYGGCDWNAADIVIARLTAVTNGPGGSYDFSFNWKTNLPGANPLTNDVYHPAVLRSPTALGTWSVTFTDNTNVTLSGPGGISTNFSLPDEALLLSNFNPSVSFMQFGIAKQDEANNGHNNGMSGAFSRIEKSGGDFQFDENFSGPGLTANNAWRVTNPNVLWEPEGLGYWLSWTTPDDGYSLTVSGNVDGPYIDAGVTYTYLQGVNRIGAVPAANLPAGNAAFFRLEKPGQ